MLLLFKRLDLGLRVLLVDSSLASISVDVCELVDGDGVFLVEGGAVKGFYNSSGFLCGIEFEEGKPIILLVEAAGSDMLRGGSYPSLCPSSPMGMYTPSFAFATVFNFRRRNLTSFSFASSLTFGRPSITTKVSNPSSI